MTREEAINILKELLDLVESPVLLTIDRGYALKMAFEALEQEPSDNNVVSRDVVKNQMIKYGFHAPDMTVTEFVEDLPPVSPKEPFINKLCVSSGVCEYDKNVVLDKIIAEIKEWYWQADKQALAKDPCVVDAMTDLFIRTIDKYKAESEG